MKELTASEAKSLITRVGPSLGCDFTYAPMYAEGRTDICVVDRAAENGRDYGFDTLYLVWKEPDDTIKYQEIRNTRNSKDYMQVKSVKLNDDGTVSVDFGSGGSFSGAPWSESMKIAISKKAAV